MSTSNEMSEINDTLVSYQISTDAMWVSICTFLVFFMQSGFALLELGSVREKNASTILLKNTLDVVIGTLAFWLIGFGIAFGKDQGQIIGSNRYAAYRFGSNDSYRDWMFQWAFAGTASTIVSGALAERAQIGAYALYASLMASVIYPSVVHWAWGGGFLSQMGYVDFAGSGVIHLVGGTAAFWGAWFVGPRIGRFDPLSTENFNPHSIPFVVTGVFILWFGWYGFNCGSTLGIHGDNTQLISKVGMNTTIGACSGGLTGFLCEIGWSYYWTYTEEFHLRLAVTPGLTNGLLSGLVAITAGCAWIQPLESCLIGIIGSFLSCGMSKLIQYNLIDDPLDAAAVHGFAGLWGVLAIGLFHNNKGLFHHSSGHLLAVQLFASLIIVIWTSVWSLMMFGLAQSLGILRVSRKVELLGLDEWETGGHAYDHGGQGSSGNQHSSDNHPYHHHHSGDGNNNNHYQKNKAVSSSPIIDMNNKRDHSADHDHHHNHHHNHRHHSIKSNHRTNHINSETSHTQEGFISRSPSDPDRELDLRHDQGSIIDEHQREQYHHMQHHRRSLAVLSHNKSPMMHSNDSVSDLRGEDSTKQRIYEAMKRANAFEVDDLADGEHHTPEILSLDDIAREKTTKGPRSVPRSNDHSDHQTAAPSNPLWFIQGTREQQKKRKASEIQHNAAVKDRGNMSGVSASNRLDDTLEGMGNDKEQPGMQGVVLDMDSNKE